jgi:hypothetical protein
MAGKISSTLKICLLLGLMLGQQVFGQQVNSVNILLPTFTPMNIGSETVNYWWLYPTGNGNKVNDVAGNFAIGAGGYIFDFPSNGLNVNFNIYNFNTPLDSVLKPLNYRKILHQELFGARQTDLLVQTDGDIYLLNTNRNFPESFYRRTSIIPDSLKGLKAAAFISFNSGVIIDNNNKVYRTLNGGQSWERRGIAPSGGIRNITITSVEDIFISYFSGALQYSSDGGTTFRISANSNEVFSNISFASDNFALATSSFRFYSTNDRGASWSELTNVPSGRPNYIEALSDSIWLLSTDSTIYRTENAGLTYRPVTTPCREGRISKFIVINSSQGVRYAAIVNSNLVENTDSSNWRPSGLRYWSPSYNPALSDNEDVEQLFVSEYPSVLLDTIYPISFRTSSNNIVTSGANFNPQITNDISKQWAINGSGTVYLSTTNTIQNDNYNNTSYYSSFPKTYPTLTKLLVKNNRVYFLKSGTNYFYSLLLTDLGAVPDSVPLATQGNLIDLDGYNDANTFEIYFLGSDGKVFEYNVGTRLTRIINFPYSTEPLRLKVSKRLIGTPSFIGATDNRGRIFAGLATANTLSDLNGSLVTSFRDFAIAGDSLFALNTDNVFYITNISDPASVIWQRDSIEISRTLTQVHIGYFNPTDTAVGKRPGRLARNEVTSYSNTKPTILLTGTGPNMISTNPRKWNNTIGSSKNRKALPPLVLYPNPTKSRSFKISVENPEWVTVIDLTGKVVASFNNPEKDIAYQLSATLSGGIYIVQAKTSKGVSTGKLIVQ